MFDPTGRLPDRRHNGHLARLEELQDRQGPVPTRLHVHVTCCTATVTPPGMATPPLWHRACGRPSWRPTVVGGQHDLTLNADNETRDILLLAFLSIPNDTRRSTTAGSPPSPAIRGLGGEEGPPRQGRMRCPPRRAEPATSHMASTPPSVPCTAGRLEGSTEGLDVLLFASLDLLLDLLLELLRR
jgi:hypothetical protein